MCFADLLFDESKWVSSRKEYVCECFEFVLEFVGVGTDAFVSECLCVNDVAFDVKWVVGAEM